MKKKYTGMAAIVIIVLLGLLLPEIPGLDPVGKKVLIVLAVALVMWITEAVPMPVTAIFLIVVQPIFGITGLQKAVSEFISPVIFFILSVTGISCALLQTSFANRFTNWMLKWTGGKGNKLVFVFTCGTALMSALVSRVPATTFFVVLAAGILEKAGERPGSSNLGKALMICIPFGAMAGGIATLPGSSVNVLTAYLLQQYAGIDVTFLDWMMFGTPIAIAVTLAVIFFVTCICRPSNIAAHFTEMANSGSRTKMNARDIKTLVIVSGILIAWMLNTWVPWLDITIVAMVGLIAFFLPGIDTLKWSEYVQEVSWDSILLVGGITSIGAAAMEAGIGNWIIGLLFSSAPMLTPFALTAVVCVTIILIHFIIPLPPAIMIIFVQPLVMLANAMSIDPIIPVMAASFLSGSVMLMPTDAIPMIAYNKRYFTIREMFSVGIWTSIVWAAVAAVWVTVAARLL